jgi:hypothetical protein
VPRSFQIAPQNAILTANPTDVLNFNPTSIIETVAPEFVPNLLAEFEAFITELLEYLKQITGLDLLGFWETTEQIISFLSTLFGDLLSGNELGAIETFLGLVVFVADDLPGDLLDDLIEVFSGGIGGPGGLFGELLSLLTLFFGGGGIGSPSSPLAPLAAVLDNIPLVGPLVEALTGTTGVLADITTWTGDLFGAFGGATSITEVATFVDTLPVIGTLVEDLTGGYLTGGTATLTNLATFFTFPGGTTSILGAIEALPQEIIDAVANALGFSGTGHTTTNLGTYLAEIPGGNISGITTVEQSVLDAIANALGHSGGGHTVSNIETYLENIPLSVLTGLSGYLTNLSSGGAMALAGVTGLTGYLTNLTSGGALALSAVTGLGGYLTNLSSGGALALSGVTGLSGYLTNLNSSGTYLADLAIGSITGLGGYLTNLTSGGALSLSAVTGLGGYLTNLSSGGALSLAGVTGLSGYLTHLTSGGVLALAGLATGAIPTGITLPGGQLTGSVATSLITNVLGTTNLGTDVQAILDHVANGLGQSGTGHSLANVTSYLSALGGAFTGATGSLSAIFTDIDTLLGNPTGLGTGSPVAPAVVADIPLLGSLLDVTDTAVSTEVLTGIDALTGDVPLLGTLLNTLTGSPTTGGGAMAGLTAFTQDLLTLLGTPTGLGTGSPATLIPSTNLLGVLGATNLGESVQTFLDGAVQGLNDVATTGNSIAQLSGAANAVATLLGWNPSGVPPTTSVSGITLTNNQFIAAQAATHAGYITSDPTGDPTVNFTTLSGATLPTTTITQANSIIGMIATPVGGVKESVAWLGGGWTGALSAMYANLYTVNTTTGALSLLFQSENLLAISDTPSNSSTPAWYYYDFPTADFITTQQGNFYAVELCVVGSGTYTLAAISHQAPPNMSVFPSAKAATRSISLTSPSYDTGGVSASSAAISGAASITVSYTLGASDNLLVAAVAVEDTAGTPTYTCTLTNSSGTALTLYNSLTYGTNYKLLIYTMENPPTGAQVISFNETAGSTTWFATVNAFSYENVGTVLASTSSTASGSSAAPAFTYTQATTGDRVLVVTAGAVAADPFTITTGGSTVRSTTAGVATARPSLTVYDVAGSASIANSLTCTSQVWGIICLAMTQSIVAPSSIPSPSYSTTIPYLELCGSAGSPTYPPDLQVFGGSGTYTIPLWAQFLDVIVYGGGGGGGEGSFAAYGNGGGAGGAAAVTITAADWAGHTSLSISIGNGGGGGGGAGGSGGATVVTYTGGATVTAAGGGGGGASGGGAAYGAAAATFAFNGETYYGGGGAGPFQNTGGQPGGGGSGGNYTYESAFDGGNGGVGAAFILAYV